MSERAISDPTEHGWVGAGDGKWMWGGSGGGSGGGSIQDGDTEGQITTWDGTEWTPEGAVVVANGNVLIGTDNDNPTAPAQNVEGISMSETFGIRSSVKNNTLTLNRMDTHGDIAVFRKDGDRGGAISVKDGFLGIRGPAAAGEDALTIDADGTVNVTSSTDTTKLNITNDSGTYEVTNNEFGSLAINYNGDERFVLASNGDVYIYGKLFINGEEVGAGGGSYSAGNGITIDGDTIKMSGSYSGTFTANTVVGSG